MAAEVAEDQTEAELPGEDEEVEEDDDYLHTENHKHSRLLHFTVMLSALRLLFIRISQSSFLTAFFSVAYRSESG